MIMQTVMMKILAAIAFLLSSAGLSTPATIAPVHLSGIVFEDFVVTQVDANGDIHGESLDGAGEGVYLDSKTAQFFLDEPVEPGDEIEVSWSEEDYAGENWDAIREIEFIN